MKPKNIKVFLPLTSSYVLRVTKFLVKLSLLEFLTEKNTFVYKLFYHKIFQILDYFLCKNYNSPLKISPPLSHQPPAPVWKFGGRLNPPPPHPERGDTGGGEECKE